MTAAALLAIGLLSLAALAGTAVGHPAGAGITSLPAAGTPPKVTQQPVAATVEEGQPASFTSAASNSPTVQWESSTDGGVNYHPIEGATSGTYTIGATNLAESGKLFRAVFTNAGGSANSKAVALTVTKKPEITQQPVDANAQEGHEASFEAKASGSPAPTVQWQESTDGGTTFKNLGGVTSTSLHLANVSKAQNGWQFRAVFKNKTAAGLNEVASAAATLHIVDPPKITNQPLDTTVIEGEDATFNSAAQGNPAPSVQWELSTDGGASWAAIAGATSPSLTVPATTLAENGNSYRAVYTNVAATVTTNPARLTVEGIPVVTQQPADATVGVGGTAGFEAAATGSPAPTVQWEVSVNEGASWSPVGGATSGSLTVSNAQLSDSGNEYRAAFKNPAGATRSSAGRLTVSATNYRAFGWGLNTRGQVGVGSNESSILTPTAVASLHFVTAVAGGRRHSLALLAGGTVEAWGYNGHLQLGNEDPNGTKSPVAVEHLTGVKAIAAGGNHSVALLRNGTVEDWGDDESGQLGNNSKIDSAVPVQVEGLSAVTAIAAGEEHTLALLSDGTVMAWGNNERGQLGTGNRKSSTTPVAVKGLTGVTAIAADGQFSLALKSDGTVLAWGDDEHGQLGNHVLTEEESEAILEVGHLSDVPVPVDGLTGVTQIAAGQTHALAVLSGGTVDAWGDDTEGELGNGAKEAMAKSPVAVSGLANVTAIVAGEKDTAAILGSGALMTWGSNSVGSLGIGTHGEAAKTPVQVTTLGEVSGVSAGGAQMLAFGEALPSVTGLSPSNGAAIGGTEVTITGTNLGATTAVHFGTAAASAVSVGSSSSVTATAPPGTGVVDVTVTTAAGTSPSGPSDRFTYLQRPVLTKLSSKGGPAAGGTVVTLTGTDLTGATEVHFGTVAATNLTVNSSTSITAVSPANVSGTVDVTVTTGGGTSAVTSKALFKYAPTVASLAPAAGPLAGGGSIVVSGNGFAPGTGTTKFKFGSTPSKSVECPSITSCAVRVPAGKALGTVDVTATANKGSSTAAEGDRYTYQ